ncbi:Unknown protein, partial [Striga hermonthica]
LQLRGPPLSPASSPPLFRSESPLPSVVKNFCTWTSFAVSTGPRIPSPVRAFESQ